MLITKHGKLSISLKDYIGKLAQFRFRAVTGSGWASDICIDDFKIEGTINHLPEFTTTANTLVMVNEEYTYVMKATDGDNDNLTFDAVKKPARLTFTDNGDGTGELKGTPQKADVGTHKVTITLLDGIATSVKQSFYITVEEEVAIILDPNTIASSDIQFTVYYPNPVDINGGVVTFEVSGKRNYRSGQLFIYDVVGNLIHSDEFSDGINPWGLNNRNGKRVAGGTYIAFLRLVDEQGEAVVLMRTIGVKDN